MRELTPAPIAPGGAPDGAGAAPRRARTGRGAAQRPALDLYNSAARVPPDGRSEPFANSRNGYTANRPAEPRYIRSIIALPNPEQLTCVEPGISRAKS